MSVQDRQQMLWEELVEVAMQSHGAEYGDLQTLDRPNGLLRLECTRNLPEQFREAFETVTIYGPTVCSRAFRCASPVFVGDVLADPAFAQYRALAEACRIRAVYSVPISVNSQIVGVVSTLFAQPRSVPASGPHEVQRWVKSHPNAFTLSRLGTTRAQANPQR